MLSEKAKETLKAGSVKLRVMRSGMYQQLTFTTKKVTLANVTYTELYTSRLLDATEISRLANEIGLPVEAANGRAFPKGTSAGDFSGLDQQTSS